MGGNAVVFEEKIDRVKANSYLKINKGRTQAAACSPN